MDKTGHRRAHPGEIPVIPTIQTVLVTTDFSTLSKRAIPYAYSVVREGGTVHLLHVVELIEPLITPNPLYAHYVPGRTPTPQERQQQQAELESRLRALIPESARATSIRTEVHVVEATEVAAAVVDTAERLNVNVVCMGTHGRSATMSIFLGSVASAVVAACDRPVLLVRGPRATG